jgi:DNA helicase IV
VVLTPRGSKGLEFDGVTIVEPQLMLDSASSRVGDLYVAMTRPTQRLRLITTGAMPEGIEG